MRRRTVTVTMLAVASLGMAACSDDARESIDEAADEVGQVADSVVSAVQEEAGNVVDAAAETAARNLATDAGEAAFEDAGYPLEGDLTCEAAAASDASQLDVSCTGTTAEGGAAALSGRTTELPGASFDELVGSFTGTVDGAEVFAVDRLGG